MSEQTCVLVLSPPRSGSSLFAGILHKFFGVSIGKSPTTVKDKYNENGYYENKRILEFNEKVLTEIGSSVRKSPLVLPDDAAEKAMQYYADLIDIIKEEFTTEIFLIKDPRILILSGLYYDVLQDYNIKPIYIFRNPSSTIKSLANFPAFKDNSRQYQLLCEYYYLMLDDLAMNQGGCFALNLIDVVRNFKSHFYRLCSYLQMDHKKVESALPNINLFTDRSLLHQGV